MIRRDYIQRLCEQAGAAVGKSLGLRHEGKIEEADKELEAACRQILGIDLKLLLALSPEDIKKLLPEDRHAAADVLLQALGR